MGILAIVEPTLLLCNIVRIYRLLGSLVFIIAIVLRPKWGGMIGKPCNPKLSNTIAFFQILQDSSSISTTTIQNVFQTLHVVHGLRNS